MNLKALRDRWAKIPGEAKAILDKAKTEGREPTDEELDRVEALNEEHGNLAVEIAEAEKTAKGLDPSKRAERVHVFQSRGVGAVIGYDADGEPVRALKPSERLADLAGGPSPSADADLGRLVRGMVTGDFAGLDVQASSSGAGSATGGVFLAPAISAAVVDLARSKSRVIEAGAMTVPMDNRELVIAQVKTDPTAYWRPETKAVTASDLVFGSVKLQARTLGVLTSASVELVEDAANLGALIRSVLAEVIAAELDRAALLGVGSAEEPLGLENVTGIGTATSIGAPTWDDVVDAQTTIATANGELGGIIMHPRTFGSLAKQKGTANDHYIAPPAAVASVPLLATSKLPINRGGGSNESIAFAGDFSQMWIGIRTGVTIEASRSAPVSSSVSAFGNLLVALRAYIRADVAVVRPSHFVLMSGITT